MHSSDSFDLDRDALRLAVPPLEAILFTIAGMGALLLGSWVPDERLILAGVPINTVLLLIISIFATFSKVTRTALRALFVLQLPLFLLGLTIAWSSDPAYGLDKLATLVITGNVAFLLFNHVIERYGPHYLAGLMLSFLTLLLIASVIFKLAFGFFAREVPFLMNGPIVFARLMSIALMLTFFLLKGRLRIVMLFTFFMSIVWTESKGPTIAAFLALFFCIIYVAPHSRRLIILSISGAIVALTIYLANRYIDPADIGRLGVLISLASGDFRVLEAAGNEGSLGIRYDMWGDTLALIPSHSFGFGLGGWQSALPALAPIKYPHNLLLELWSEGGVVLGTFALMPFVWFLFVPKNPFYFVALSLLIAQMVSGDIADARMLLIFSMIATISVPLSKRTNVPSV